MRREFLATQEIMKRIAAERVRLVIRGMPYPCWKCGYDDVAVAAIHVEGIADMYHVIPAEDELALAYAAELLAVVNHPKAATIKARRSRTAQETYISNGCLNCDALFGQSHVAEKLDEVLVSNKVSTLPVLATVERTAIEWYSLVGLSAANGTRIW